MTDIIEQATRQERMDAFQAEVAEAGEANFRFNREQLDAGRNVFALALANAFASADLIAATLAENPGVAIAAGHTQEEMIDIQLSNLVKDMKIRLLESFHRFSEQIKQDAENQQPSTGLVTA